MLLKTRDLLMEMAEYRRSWLIIDMDSVAQVMREESNPDFEHSMGLAASAGLGISASSSVSYRIQHAHLFTVLIDAARSSASEKGGTKFIFTSSHPYMITAIRDALRWPESAGDAINKLQCFRRSCLKLYTEEDNPSDACRYHPARLIHEGSLRLSYPRQVWEEIDANGVRGARPSPVAPLPGDRAAAQRQPEFKRYTYLCCGATITSLGCQDAPHRRHPPTLLDAPVDPPLPRQHGAVVDANLRTAQDSRSPAPLSSQPFAAANPRVTTGGVSAVGFRMDVPLRSAPRGTE